MRVGITTGEVLARLSRPMMRGEAKVSGDVVNTASGCRQSRRTVECLVDAAARTGTGAIVQFEPSEPVSVKGKADPVSVWLARGSSRVRPMARTQSCR